MSGAAFQMLAWDSELFGFPTARILSPRLGRSDLEALLAELAGQGVKLAYWSANPGHVPSGEAAAACGGFLADTRLTFRADLSARPASAEPMTAAGWDISPVRASEPDAALLALAVRAGLHSRFHTDPRFPPALFRSLYEEWMRGSLSGRMADAVLKAEIGGILAGMVTVSARQGAGSIGLIAVDAGQEGRGLGTALVRAAGLWFASRGCGSASVVTQEGNAAACALYGRNGYGIDRREQVWHFWPGA